MEIYLLRHGIAEDRASSGKDADRALTNEGRKKVREVCKLASGAGVAPTLILTSPLKRALQTAEIAADELGHKDELLRSDRLTPDSSPRDAWDAIREHGNAQAVLAAGHEPLFSALAAFLLGSPELRIDFKKGMLVRIDVEAAGPVPKGVLAWALTPKLAGK